MAALEQRIEAERKRADRMEAAANNERQDFLNIEATTRRELEIVRRRTEQAEQGKETAEREAEQVRTQIQEAQEVVEALRQAETDWRAKGRWARLRAAWRGE